METAEDEAALEVKIAELLEKNLWLPCSGFDSKQSRSRNRFLVSDPFNGVELTKNIRLYVSFLKQLPDAKPSLPWTSEDNSYRILTVRGPYHHQCAGCFSDGNAQGHGKCWKKLFGKDITTRKLETLCFGFRRKLGQGELKCLSSQSLIY